MSKQISVQIIENNGRPEWAVIPYEDYLRLRELDDITKDVQAFKKSLHAGDEELIPEEYANRLIDGENAIRVWRQYRGITQTSLAKTVEISVPYLSQLEHNERTASTDVLKKIAVALQVSLDDIA